MFVVVYSDGHSLPVSCSKTALLHSNHRVELIVKHSSHSVNSLSLTILKNVSPLGYYPSCLTYIKKMCVLSPFFNLLQSSHIIPQLWLPRVSEWLLLQERREHQQQLGYISLWVTSWLLEFPAFVECSETELQNYVPRAEYK